MRDTEALVDRVAMRIPAAVELAAFAALAVRAEPELLRVLRLELMPHAGASAEGDLWHSRLVRSRGPNGIVLDHDVAEVLRRRLAQTGDGMGSDVVRARRIVETLHADISPALALEEEVIWLSVSGAPVEAIDRALYRALAALATGERPGLADWAADVAARLPERARDSHAGLILSEIEAARHGGSVALRSATDGSGKFDLAMLLAGSRRVRLGVRRRGSSLELGDVEREGAAAIELPATEPRVVDVLWSDPDRSDRVKSVAVARGAVERIEVGRGPVRLRNVLDELVELPGIEPTRPPSRRVRGGLVRQVQVVLASGADTVRERNLAQRVVADLNSGLTMDTDVYLSLWRWEAGAGSGLRLEGPQGLIDDHMELADADLLIGVFWKHFGLPAAEPADAVEHELHRAVASWHERGQPELMLYFCAQPYEPKSREEVDAWGRVLEFRGATSDHALWRSYQSPQDFETSLRDDLTRYVLTQAAPRRPRSAERRVRFNLPPVAATFTDREAELAALEAALGVADRAVVTQSITGLGGVGKSQLAARYVHARAEEFDVVAWIGAQDGGTADLARLAVALDTSVEGLGSEELARRARDALSTGTDRWLLVLDNVESADRLARLLPTGGEGRVLVTSRDRALREFGPLLALDVLDEEAAVAYLLDRAGRPGDAVAARRLARALGCLPLALSHAATYCQSGTSFSDYHALLDALPMRELFAARPEVFYEQTVASTWTASMRAAVADSPLATTLLQAAAFLAREPIPKSLFAGLPGDSSAVGRRRLTDAFNALARYSLAWVADETMTVHTLLQRSVREDIPAGDDERVLQRVVAALDEAFPRDVRSPLSWPLCERLLPHVIALSDTARDASGDVARSAVALLGRACAYLNHARPGERALAVASASVAYADRVVGGEDELSLRARGSLAKAYLGVGRAADALKLGERTIVTAERALGVDHPVARELRGALAASSVAAHRTAEVDALADRGSAKLLADYVEARRRSRGASTERLPRAGGGPRDTRGLRSEIARQLRLVLRDIGDEVTDCPRLFTLVPITAEGAKALKLWDTRSRLTLWCEHADHEHPWSEASYELKQNKEWASKLAPYAAVVVRTLQLVVPVATAGLGVGMSKQEMQSIKDELELMKTVVETLPAPEADGPGRGQDDGGLTRAEGGGLRALRALLADIDPASTFGGLRRRQTPSGDFVWICPEHIHEYDPGLPVLPQPQSRLTPPEGSVERQSKAKRVVEQARHGWAE